MNPELNLPSPKTITPYPVVANITFPEGPAFDDLGNLYFVNYLAGGTIGRMTPDGTVSVWVNTNGGAGGIKYDGQGHIVAANQGAQRIVRFDRRTRSMETLADGYEGQSFKGPNDLCLDQNANVYFSDPGPMVQGIQGEIYGIKIGADGTPGPVTLLDHDLNLPNGIAVHPDGSG